MSVKSEFKTIDSRLYNNGICNITNEYISVRYEKSVKWYIEKANYYKKMYFILSCVGILFPSIITVFTWFDISQFYSRLIVGIVSVLVTFSTSFLALSKPNEKWIHYRYVAELLQSELTNYLLKIGKYDIKEEERNKVFAQTVENLMSHENKKWKEIVSDKGREKNEQK